MTVLAEVVQNWINAARWPTIASVPAVDWPPSLARTSTWRAPSVRSQRILAP
jgi:hypothetical protein